MSNNNRENVDVKITLYFKNGFKKPVYDEEGKEVFILRDVSPPSLLTGEYSCKTTISLKPDVLAVLERATRENSGNQTDFDYLRKTNKKLYDEIMELVLSENPDFRKVILREFPSEVLARE